MRKMEVKLKRQPLETCHTPRHGMMLHCSENFSGLALARVNTTPCGLNARKPRCRRRGPVDRAGGSSWLGVWRFNHKKKTSKADTHTRRRKPVGGEGGSSQVDGGSNLKPWANTNFRAFFTSKSNFSRRN